MIDPGPAAQTMGGFKGRRNAQGRYVALAASSGDGGDTGNGGTVYTASGVSGTLAQDGIITISAQSGESFGNGPKIANMEDYRAGAGNHLGGLENSDQRLVGDYYQIVGTPHYYTEDYHSSGACMIHLQNDPSLGISGAGRMAMTTDEDNDPDNPDQEFYTEQFLSYWMKCPGLLLPYGQTEDTHPGERQFPAGSNWKSHWLMQGNRGDTGTQGAWANDMVMFSYVSTIRSFGGNNGGSRVGDPGTHHKLFGVSGQDSGWWQWDHWMRLTYWISDNKQKYMLHFCSPGRESGGLKSEGPTIAPLGPMNVLKNGAPYSRDLEPGTLILEDDLYWAVGDNAAARVEIGNASEYMECTELCLCKPESWSDSEITLQALFGALEPAPGQTIFVFNGQNQLVTKRTIGEA